MNIMEVFEKLLVSSILLYSRILSKNHSGNSLHWLGGNVELSGVKLPRDIVQACQNLLKSVDF